MANTNPLDNPLYWLSVTDDQSQAASTIEEVSKFVQATADLINKVGSHSRRKRGHPGRLPKAPK
jgi:hypothetical protein